MKCFDCQHENPRGSKFCSNCGKDFKAKKSGKDNNSAYPDHNAVKIYEGRLKERANNPVVVTSVWILILVVAFFLSGADILSTILVGLFTSIFYVAILKATLTINEDFYYTIPTSKDINGEHRCIFCGNKGIYKNTIYRTSITQHSCTKCRKSLFRS